VFTYGSVTAINHKLLLLEAFHFFKEIVFNNGSKAENQIISKYTISSYGCLFMFCFNPVLLKRVLNRACCKILNNLTFRDS